MNIRLADQPEYMAALTAARDHFASGCLPHDAYEAVAFRSCEIAAISEALDQGEDIRGGFMATAFHNKRLVEFVFQ